MVIYGWLEILILSVIGLEKKKSSVGTQYSSSRGSAATSGSYCSSQYEIGVNNLPWTKRKQPGSKKNRQRARPNTKKSNISNSFDQIRTINMDSDSSKFEIILKDYEYSFWSWYGEEGKSAVISNLLHSRRSLSSRNSFGVDCCDGVFGC